MPSMRLDRTSGGETTPSLTARGCPGLGAPHRCVSRSPPWLPISTHPPYTPLPPVQAARCHPFDLLLPRPSRARGCP